MNNMGFPILSLVAFLPLVGALAILVLVRSSDNLARWMALLTSGITFLV